MKIFSIAILALLFLTSCETQNNSNTNEKVASEKFCKNEKELISGGGNISTINLNLNQVSDEIYNQVENYFGPEDSSSSFIFKVPYNTKTESIDSMDSDILFKAIINKPGATGCFLFPQRRFGILVNKNNQMLIQAEHIGDYQYITEELSLFYDDTTGGVKKIIWIYWDDHCDKVALEKVFDAIIDGYLVAASKYSIELFSKELCQLDADELNELKTQVPFDLILDLKHLITPPPPPPPFPKK